MLTSVICPKCGGTTFNVLWNQFNMNLKDGQKGNVLIAKLVCVNGTCGLGIDKTMGLNMGKENKDGS